MQYLKIRNAGFLDRQFLYFIGGSKKRAKIDDLYTIGNRGSGLKLATIGALKLGIKVIVSSVDQHGTYLMRPFTKEIEIDGFTYHQICHEYFTEVSEMEKFGDVQETPYLLESFEDWDDPIGADDKKIFKSLREFITNARDEDKKFQLTYASPQEVVAARSNESIVYLEATKELIALLSPKELPRYFKFFKDCPRPYHSEKGVGLIYPKSDPSMTRLFVRDVIGAVLNDKSNSSCFDYSLFDHYLLSEEKVVKVVDTYRQRVGVLLETITDATLAGMILVEIAFGRGEFENRSFTWSDFSLQPTEATMNAYLTAWNYIFPAKNGKPAILPVHNSELNHRAAETGYEIKNLNLSQSFRDFLHVCGVKTSADVVPLQGKMDFLPADESELNVMQLAVYNWARVLLYRYFPNANKYPIRLLKSKPGGNVTDICGIAGEKETEYKEICLNIAHPHFNILKTLLQTMVHEYRHCVTATSDYKDKFVKAADGDIVDVIFKSEIEHNRHVKPKSP